MNDGCWYAAEAAFVFLPDGHGSVGFESEAEELNLYVCAVLEEEDGADEIEIGLGSAPLPSRFGFSTMLYSGNNNPPSFLFPWSQIIHLSIKCDQLIPESRLEQRQRLTIPDVHTPDVVDHSVVIHEILVLNLRHVILTTNYNLLDTHSSSTKKS
ncbi:hypothetical protein V5O48_012920 [Marasmius crinis-equi]|uniref:Uncharacterized protein n=1 Tax=Marasmius crinis-equi TaxID=585013 RepID=A0ABR3F1P0_9AGAR